MFGWFDPFQGRNPYCCAYNQNRPRQPYDNPHSYQEVRPYKSKPQKAKIIWKTKDELENELNGRQPEEQETSESSSEEVQVRVPEAPREEPQEPLKAPETKPDEPSDSPINVTIEPDEPKPQQ